MFAFPIAQSFLKPHLGTYRSKTRTRSLFERFGPRPALPVTSTIASHHARGPLIPTTKFFNCIRICATSWEVLSLRLPTNMSQSSTRILGTSYSFYNIARSSLWALLKLSQSPSLRLIGVNTNLGKSNVSGWIAICEICGMARHRISLWRLNKYCLGVSKPTGSCWLISNQ